MLTWWIVNLNTGETRHVRAYNNRDACEAVGWRLAYCDARILPPREMN
jgi:hypothetical protein